MEHNLKIRPKYFIDVESGKKPFEIRKNDRNYEIGDYLILNEYDPDKQDYTGRSVRRLITYIMSDERYCIKGYVILGIPAERAVGKKKKPSERKVFIPPTVEEVREYCIGRQNNINAEEFIDFYTSKNWMVGKNKMSDWRAAVRTWKHNKSNNSKKNALTTEAAYDLSKYMEDIVNKPLVYQKYNKE